MLSLCAGTKYYLHTRTGANVSEEIYTDSLSESTLLEKRDTKIIIHGWQENSDRALWISPMVTALLDLVGVKTGPSCSKLR